MNNIKMLEITGEEKSLKGWVKKDKSIEEQQWSRNLDDDDYDGGDDSGGGGAEEMMDRRRKEKAEEDEDEDEDNGNCQNGFCVKVHPPHHQYTHFFVSHQLSFLYIFIYVYIYIYLIICKQIYF